MNYRVTENMYREMHHWMKAYIWQKCLIRDVVMPAKTPGKLYSWMFYLRRGLFNTEFLGALGLMFTYKMERLDPSFNFQLSGIETAATPMLSALPLLMKPFGINMNAFVVRKEQKTYGLQNWIEGIPNEKPVLMVDDLCNSSNSMERCRKILLQENLQISRWAFVIVNKATKYHSIERHNTDMYLPKDIKVISLFNLEDFGLDKTSH